MENYRALLTISDKDLENCQFQSEFIDYTEFKHIVNSAGYSQLINRKLIDDFQYSGLRKFRRLDRKFTLEYYFVLNLLYSVLLHADKTDAIMKGDFKSDSKLLSSEDVRYYKNRLTGNPANPINKIRETAFLSTDHSINTLSESDRILSINIPTGSGKTVTSLFAALKLCEKFGHDHVVYCLPFTSVIDQNFQVFDNICKASNLPVESGVLLKHHHLTDIRYNSVRDDDSWKEYSPNEALHLIEGWESRITVTTFVQFISSLVSYKNASLRKFHRFSNVVIILDEVQSIPHEYWSIIKEILMKMTEWMDSRIILVTATMPLIFSEDKEEITELVSGKKEMFAGLNRIELDVSYLNQEKMEWGEFCDIVAKLVISNSGKDFLFVVNTIRSAKDLFQIISGMDIPHRLEFLSAHVIPKQRLKRIEKIKNRDKNTPILVVSTQLVEAGVDIDLDIVVRDFAPLDSIFQACGRCNREARSGIMGKVILLSLKDSNEWDTSGIYKNFLKQKSKKVLNDKDVIYESEFFKLANEYFHEVKIGGSQTSSEELVKKIEFLKYQDGDSRIEINLIDDQYSSSVFVEFDNEANRIWKKYLQVMEMENSFTKNAELKQIRSHLAEYIINIPKKCLPMEHDKGIYYLRHDRVLEYYDTITGFDLNGRLPPEKSSEIF